MGVILTALAITAIGYLGKKLNKPKRRKGKKKQKNGN